MKMINPNIFLAIAFLLLVVFIIFYAIADYNKKEEIIEELEIISNYLRNIEIELKREK